MDWRTRLKGDIEQTSPQAVRRHTGREPSDPPMWPPESVVDKRPGAGNPSISSGPPPKLEKVHKSFTWVWGILVTLFAAASAGWTARSLFIKPLVEDAVKTAIKPLEEQLKEMRSFQEINQRSNEASFAAINTNIEWLKRKDVVMEQQPMTRKPNSAEKPR